MPQAQIEDILFHGTPAIRIQAPDGATATVLLHGGHVVSWTPAGGQERLYLSELASYVPDKPVRGGVPVIFPQFSDRGPLPKHGFARTQAWTKLNTRGGEDFAMVTVQLQDNPATRALWPHTFSLELSVGVTGPRLDLELEVSNTGEQSFAFTTALHTYLRVKEVEEIRLEGLTGRHYTDCLRDKAQRVDTGVFLAIEDEIDRVYRNVTRPLLLSEQQRSLGIHAENMPDVIVWNPWETSIGKFSDMAPKDFRRMLCVEAAVVETPQTLAPGQNWWGRQTLFAL